MPLIPRKRDDLPRDLVQRGGDLDQLITIAASAFESRTYGAAGVVNSARDQLRKLCSSYEPSRVNVGDIICSSGEVDGCPRRPGCYKCIVSQFSPQGVYLGEVIGFSTDTGVKPSGSTTTT